MRSLRTALRSYVDLLVVLVPTYVAVTLLAHSPVLPWITDRLAPSMGLFGLPGSAAVPLVLGATVGMYAGLVAAGGIGLAPGEITTLALMMGLCHNLVVEGGLLARMGQPAWAWTLVRIAVAGVAGAMVGPLLR